MLILFWFCVVICLRTYSLIFSVRLIDNHHVIGIKKSIVLCSLWRVTRIYANLSKQKKKFTKEKSSTPTEFVWNTNMAAVTSCENAPLPGNQFSCIKRVNRPFKLVCYFVLPFHQTWWCFSRELFHLNVLLSSCARALYECIIYEIRLKTSRGLQWENQKLYFH